MSGNIIRSAILEWNTNPVITSLDSIAIPVEFTQFPTITVCNDKGQENHDNWAYIESILNFLEFFCQTPSSQKELNLNCSVTDPLRKDFKYLFDSYVDVVLGWPLQDGNFKESLKLFTNKSRDDNWSKVMGRATELLMSGEISIEEVMETPKDFFNKYLGGSTEASTQLGNRYSI